MPHTHFGQTRSPLGPIFLGTQTVVITNQRPSKGHPIPSDRTKLQGKELAVFAGHR